MLILNRRRLVVRTLSGASPRWPLHARHRLNSRPPSHSAPARSRTIMCSGLYRWHTATSTRRVRCSTPHHG
jgi:hypothetical protein